MTEAPLVHKIAAAAIVLYGLTAIVGGIMGYRAGSTASLIAGGISGVLLLLCAFGAFQVPVWSFVGALVIGLALLGRFAPKVLGSMSEMGEFLGTTAGKVGLLMTVGGLLVVILSGLAAATKVGPPSSP